MGRFGFLAYLFHAQLRMERLQCAFPLTKLGAPFKPVFWLEWDTTALDAPFLSSFGMKIL